MPEIDWNRTNDMCRSPESSTSNDFLKFLCLIVIIKFCLKIYGSGWYPHLGVGVWVVYCAGQWMGSCYITRNSIIRKLIKIIQLCLKVFVLWRHSHPIPPTPLGVTPNIIIHLRFNFSTFGILDLVILWYLINYLNKFMKLNAMIVY